MGKGADPAIENYMGFTPLQLAESQRMWPVVNYLANYREQQLDNAPNAYGFADSSALVQQVSRVLQAPRQQQEPAAKEELKGLMKQVAIRQPATCPFASCSQKNLGKHLLTEYVT